MPDSISAHVLARMGTFFELKFFFNSAAKVASKTVKHIISALVRDEDPQRPHSDQALVDMLENNYGIQVARRTVQKYRKELSIPKSSERAKAQ